MIDPKKIEALKWMADLSPVDRQHEPGCPTVADDESDHKYLSDAGQCACGLDFYNAAREAVPEILAEREEMLALLREIEWKGCAQDYDTEQGVVWSEGGCPVCNGGGAHEAGCRLAAFLKPDARTVPK